MSLPVYRALLSVEGERTMYIGVDTQKKTHTLVVLDDQGRTCGTRTVTKRR